MPNPVLSDEQWAEVEKAAIAGVTYGELAQRFKIEANCIRQRAFAKEWAVPSRVQKLKELYAASKADNPDQDSRVLTKSNNSPTATEIVAETLEKYGDETAILVARGTSALLKRTFDPEKPLLDAPKDWKSANTALSMLWKATGRDKQMVAVQVNNNWSGPTSGGWEDEVGHSGAIPDAAIENEADQDGSDC